MGKRKIDCIYCEPGKHPYKEDFVLQAIGGSYSPSSIICGKCKSYLEANVDHRTLD